MSNPDLDNIQIVEPHELWKDEARDFTPWLAENAQQLSEAIGIPIEIDSTEKEVGDFNMDFECKLKQKNEIVTQVIANYDKLKKLQVMDNKATRKMQLRYTKKAPEYSEALIS